MVALVQKTFVVFADAPVIEEVHKSFLLRDRRVFFPCVRLLSFVVAGLASPIYVRASLVLPPHP